MSDDGINEADDRSGAATAAGARTSAAAPIGLTYAPPPPRPPGPVGPLLLCLPGAVCWLAFLGIVFGRFIPDMARQWLSPLRVFAGIPVLLCWGLAIVTALVSLATYARRKPKRWYVWVNLLVNVSGLAMTAVIVGLIVYVMAKWEN